MPEESQSAQFRVHASICTWLHWGQISPLGAAQTGAGANFLMWGGFKCFLVTTGCQRIFFFIVFFLLFLPHENICVLVIILDCISKSNTSNPCLGMSSQSTSRHCMFMETRRGHRKGEAEENQWYLLPKRQQDQWAKSFQKGGAA